MERLKASAKRPGKGKVPAPGDLVALGSKNKPDSSSVSQVKKVLPPLKREAGPSSLGSSLGPKKPKLSTGHPIPLGRAVEGRGSPARQVPQYEEIAIEVDPVSFLDSVLEAEDSCDDERIEGLMCGAVKSLRANRAKPHQAYYLSLMYLSKTRPSFFVSEIVIEAFCSILKRDMSINFKAKGNALVSVLACNVLMAAYQEEENWPDAFMKVYLEDSMGERIWVDRAECKAFVDNIQTAFNTRVPPKSVLMSAEKTETIGSSSPLPSMQDEDSQASSDAADKQSTGDDDDTSFYPRYMYMHDEIEGDVLDTIKDVLLTRQGKDNISRSLLKLLAATCGYSEVRALASQRLEMWLQNPKLTRPAQDLLMAVCMNCNQYNKHDVEVMANVSKIRLKMKPMITHYLSCIRELLNQHQDNPKTLMTQTIYNELSSTRNPNNMNILSTVFQALPDDAPKYLAEIFQDLLANKTDYLKNLRVLLREIVRSLRHEINFPSFCLGLMQERSELVFVELDSQSKDRLLFSITDLITLCQLLCVNPSVREAASAQARGDQRDLAILRNFQTQIATIQRDAVWWLHSVVPKMFKMKANEFAHSLHKVVFLEQAEQYYKLDMWPPEGERGTMLRLVSEVSVLEDTLMRVILIGLTKEYPFSTADALELADQLVKRAASLNAPDFPVLQCERLELNQATLNLSAYKHPENIALPKGYTPPSLAISVQYWKAWVMLLVVTAYNPATFGLSAWENYPTLKMLMEMVMTNNYRFPPPTVTTDEKMIEEIRNKEKQESQLEKQEILEFEGHLAAATNKVTITEHNSLLISQLTTMNPHGLARKPPHQVLEQIKQLNQTLNIGHMLCRSRSPDFLLDIIQRQGTSQSMPWLAELVESSEGSLDILPVQCLCEFLLHDTTPEGTFETDEEEESKAERHKRKQKIKKQEQLLSRLQALVHSDNTTVCEVLEYFFRRLTSQQAQSRALAIKGLSMVLSKSHLHQEFEEMQIDDDIVKMPPSQKWLLGQLPTLPLFPAVRDQACIALRQACQIETDAKAVSAYITFLSQYTATQQLQQLDDLALDMAQLIVERPSIIGHILPDIYHPNEYADTVLSSLLTMYVNYMTRAKQPEKEAYSWSDTQDQIMLQWPSGESATMNVLVVHAMIILLTYGPPKETNPYTELLETWFPAEGNPPSAYLVDTSEEALLLPDWLKLKMLRSSVQRLVDAALLDLEPSQLLLFVQSFGIPSQSMSKLLERLDEATRVDSESMEQQVQDKTYMAQLVEVQQMRGAKEGNVFLEMLNKGKETEKPADVQMTTPSRRKRTPSQIFCRGQVPTLPDNIKQIQDMLCKIFALKGSTDQPGALENFKTVQKVISRDVKASERTLQAIFEVLQSSNASSFVLGLHQCSNKSCPLFRVIFSQKEITSSEKIRLCEIIQQLSKDIKSPLTSVVAQYMSTHSTQRRQSLAADIVDRMKNKEGNIDEQILIKALESQGNVDDSVLERVVDLCMVKDLKSNQAKRRTETSLRILENEKNRLPPLSSTAGLMVDWLELLDPEIIQACPDMQQQLLFAKQQLPSDQLRKSNHVSGQPYLLALLTHKTNWPMLHRCISRVLRPQNLTTSNYHATDVLDFLWACVHIPKIWQGRDRKLPKNYQLEDVLHLTEAQLCQVVEYILQEAFDASSGAEENKNQHAYTSIDKRLPLLQRCMCARNQLIQAAVGHLQKAADSAKSGTANFLLTRHFLQELYLQIPLALSQLPKDESCLTDMRSTESSSSQLDVISHRLLSTLGNAKPGKISSDHMFDANIALRKMASKHPVLLLRQLPMMSGLLQGRIHFTFGEFNHRNYLLLFTQVLGILELLVPNIFQKQYSALDDILAAYFEVIKVHGLQNKQLAPLIIKYIQFLHQFVHHDSIRAVQIIQEYSQLLSCLSEVYPDLSILKSLRAGLSLPRQSENEGEVETEATVPVATPARSSSPLTVAQLAPFLKRINKGAKTEDVLEVLEDLDKTSKRKVDILEHFMGDLKRLLSVENDKCRNLAHTLVMRHIRQKPSSGRDLVPIFLNCLDNPNHDVVNSALKNLAEFAVLCQDQASVLLQKAFSVGISTKIDTNSYINETMQLLNLETMVT